MWPRALELPQIRSLALKVAAGLIFVRCLAYIPVATPAPDLRRLFEQEPFLAILDVLAGGALGRSSVLALGVAPYLAGWLIARVTYGKVEGAFDDRRRRSFTYAYTAIAAVCMGSVYLYLLSRVAQAPLVSGFFSVAGVASLTAGSLLFAWVAELALPDVGLRFFVAANVLAAVPSYVLHDLRSVGDAIFIVLTLLAAVAIHAVFLSSSRNVPTYFIKRIDPRLPGAGGHLPIGLDPSGLIPLLFPLLALGIMRIGASVLAGSRSLPIRWLAGIELQLTDVRSLHFWVLLIVLAVPIKIAFDYSGFNPADIALTFKKEGTLIPGLRPGKSTETYLRRVWSKVAWAGPLATMLVLAGTALVYYGERRTGLWPVMLGLILFTVKPVLGFTSHLGAVALIGKYQGFVK
jgi:preprotein translocase subunit SecY